MNVFLAFKSANYILRYIIEANILIEQYRYLRRLNALGKHETTLMRLKSVPFAC